MDLKDPFIETYRAIPANVIENETNIYELLNKSFQGVRRLFVLVLMLQIMMMQA